MRYQLPTSINKVGNYFQQLYRKQGNNEKIQDWWMSLTTAHAYLLFGMRHVDDVVLCDIVKDNALSLSSCIVDVPHQLNGHHQGGARATHLHSWSPP